MSEPVSARDLDVVTAWAAVMADVQAIAKAEKNTQQNFMFRGIDAVMNSVGPVLRAHGVVVIPTVEECHYRDFTTKSGTLMHECTVRVTFTVYGPNGGTLKGTVWGESADAGDKATAKAHSVAYRTFLLQSLTIPTHDPDPDSFTYERSQPAPVFGKAQAKNLLVELVGKDDAVDVWAHADGDGWEAYSPFLVREAVKVWNERPMSDPA